MTKKMGVGSVAAAAILLGYGVAGALGCSSGGGDNTGDDSGTTPAKDSGAKADTGTPDDSGSNADTGPIDDGGTTEGGPCTKPGTLHPPSADAGGKTLFCPFSGADGGKDVYCNPSTQHCCEPSKGTSTCSPTASTCAMGDIDWQCGDPKDCGGNKVCCGTGAFVSSGSPQCANYATGFKGTHCAASCTAMEIEVCTSTSECPMGKTCTPFSTHGAQVGACQ